MPATSNVLRVFLASPSDVLEERELAEEVVGAVNKLIRRLGWHIDLHKWEDTPPGFGRPQAQINSMVDECDLFIGLLWQKWGQASGQYSSGFEEEYERARASRKASGRPEIWLIFKNVDADKLNDPGEQLKKVIQFQEVQVDLKEVLFKRVRDVDDWKTNLQLWLTDHIFSLYMPLPGGQPEPTGVLPALESPDRSPAESKSQLPNQPLPEQLKELSASLGDALETGSRVFFSNDESPLSEFEVVRLSLLTSTLVARRRTGEVLGTHEINLLYKHREELEAAHSEMHQLFRTIVEDSGGVKPGWYWFRDVPRERVKDALVSVVHRDPSDQAKIRALELLTGSRISIPLELWPALPFYDESITIRERAFDYVGAMGDETVLVFLENIADPDDPKLTSLIKDARLQILARLDPNRAFSEMIANDASVSGDKLQSLLTHLSAVDDQTLLSGTRSSMESTRRASLEELLRRGSLSTQLAEELTKDPSLVVRAIAFQTLAARGSLPDLETVRRALKETDDEGSSKTWRTASLAALMGGRASESLPDIDSIIVTFYRTQSTETLLSAVDWFSSEGHLAYEALARDRFDEISAELRSDLVDGFKRIKDESSRRVEKKYGPEGGPKYVEAFQEYEGFIGSQFTKAALCGLAENAQPQDAALARPYLTHTYWFVQNPAVTVVAKFGNQEDVGVLLEIAKATYGEAAKEAAAGALRLSPDPVKVARELLQTTKSDVAKVAFDWMYQQDSREVGDLFVELLDGKDDARRVRALYYFFSHLQREELETMLEEYLSKDIYYYNVVTWLDRVLYSPSPLREVFVKELQEKA